MGGSGTSLASAAAAAPPHSGPPVSHRLPVSHHPHRRKRGASWCTSQQPAASQPHTPRTRKADEIAGGSLLLETDSRRRADGMDNVDVAAEGFLDPIH